MLNRNNNLVVQLTEQWSSSYGWSEKYWDLQLQSSSRLALTREKSSGQWSVTHCDWDISPSLFVPLLFGFQYFLGSELVFNWKKHDVDGLIIAQAVNIITLSSAWLLFSFFLFLMISWCSRLPSSFLVVFSFSFLMSTFDLSASFILKYVQHKLTELQSWCLLTVWLWCWQCDGVCWARDRPAGSHRRWWPSRWGKWWRKVGRRCRRPHVSVTLALTVPPVSPLSC